MRLFILASILCSCQKQAPEVPEHTGPMHPELVCPEAAITGGKVPPEGFEAWCHSPTPEGRWYRNGPSISWHPNGQKSGQGTYEAGKQNGEWTYWFANGAVQKRVVFTYGAEDGPMTEYHSDGSKASEGMMSGGLASGPWLYWSADGTLRTEGSWNAGRQDGTWTAFDVDTNQPVTISEYRQGRMTTSRPL